MKSTFDGRRSTVRRQSADCGSAVRAALVCLLVGIAALMSARPVAAQDTHLIVITGVEGDEEHGAQFHKWATQIIDVAEKKGGLTASTVTYLADKVERDPMRIRGRSTAENIRKTFADLAMRAQPNDEVFVVMFGHGSYDGRQAALNLPGPDLTVPDYAALLDKIRAGRIVFVNTASSSGEFLKGLAGPNRTIVTATKTGGERNETRFPPFFVEAFTSEAADGDRNGRISVQEAFEYARNKVQQAFEREGYVPSEHAAIAEAGGGAAASLYLESERARTAEIANVANPALRAALEEKRKLEEQIAGLRLRKPSMPADEYDKEFEKLATALALNSRTIQQLEAKK